MTQYEKYVGAIAFAENLEKACEITDVAAWDPEISKAEYDELVLIIEQLFV